MLEKLWVKLRGNSSRIVVNGQDFVGGSVSIVDGSIVVDGKVVASAMTPRIEIHVHGDVDVLKTAAGDVSVTGNAKEVTTTSGDIRCADVGGNVSTVSGDVQAKTIHGRVSTVSGDISR